MRWRRTATKDRVLIASDPTSSLAPVSSVLHSVVVLAGETGSGKTTQVPQMLLDRALAAGLEKPCRVVCTQPRRIRSGHAGDGTFS